MIVLNTTYFQKETCDKSIQGTVDCQVTIPRRGVADNATLFMVAIHQLFPYTAQQNQFKCWVRFAPATRDFLQPEDWLHLTSRYLDWTLWQFMDENHRWR